MRHTNKANTAMPLGQFLVDLGVMLVLGLAGALLLPFVPVAGVLLIALALLIAVSLLRDDPDPADPTRRRRSGASALAALYTELELRRIVHGESFGDGVRPERSLTRRF